MMTELPDLPVFYSPEGPDLTGIIQLDGAEYRHATSVLRLGPEDRVLVADGKGRYYDCKIEQTAKKSLSARVNGMFHRDRDAGHELILAFALIKNRQRIEWMLEKSTELGVAGIVLFTSERSERSIVRLDRLENILVSAIKQSKRYFLPGLTRLGSMDDVFRKYSGCRFIVAHEKESERQVTADILQPGRKILFTGPEGGFTEGEMDAFRQNQAITVSLGPNRLRSETAAIALLAKFI
jgi:16S rRNA (uracil1498-N3)-methyltransferase